MKDDNIKRTALIALLIIWSVAMYMAGAINTASNQNIKAGKEEHNGN